MNQITLLSQDTIDKIAAGEVVERPASIVKELVENAIDAGANAVTVEIKDGGISLIRITDNGSGIPKEQVRVAFLRHATSKIRTVEDLLTSGTLGFRGEALSSIAAVCQVEMITKTAGSLTGVRYVIEGGAEVSLEEIGAPEGTTFLVRNLFYHTPARKKFLKSAATEAGYVSDLMERMALSHPQISFKFINNRDTRLHTSGNCRLRDVVYGVFGREIASNVVRIEAGYENLKITGLIGKPVISRGNRNYENYFVNGRYVKSAIIARAIEDAYKPFMMSHRYPFTVLMLEIDTSLVDVNVHPTKMEVRFAGQSEIYEQVYQAVKEGLVARELIPEFTIDTKKEERASGEDGSLVAQRTRKDGAAGAEVLSGTEHAPGQEQGFEAGDVSGKQKSFGAVQGPGQEKNSGAGYGPGAEMPSGAEHGQELGSGAGCRPGAEHGQGQKQGSVAGYRPGAEHASGQEQGFGAEHGPEKKASGEEGQAARRRVSYPEPFEKVRSQLLAEAQSPYEVKYPYRERRTGVMRPVTGNVVPGHEQQSGPECDRLADRKNGSPQEDRAEDNPPDSGRPETGAQMELFDDRLLTVENRKRHKLIGQVFDTYWIVEFQDRMYIIDQHAAHEKVMYERFMKDFRKKQQTSQMITPPVIVTLSMQEEEKLKQHLEHFRAVGFEIEHFGGKEYSIRAVPGNLYGLADRALFTELLDGLTDISEKASADLVCEKIASMSCKAAVKGNHRMSAAEADALIEELLALENPYNCPHGRPTIIAMTKYELEKKFKRIV